MKKEEAKLGMKVHPLGRGDKVLFIVEINDTTAGVASLPNLPASYSLLYSKIIKFKNQD